MARKDEEKRREFQAYQAFRRDVERSRECDRQERNLIKAKQLELFETMQVWMINITYE